MAQGRALKLLPPGEGGPRVLPVSLYGRWEYRIEKALKGATVTKPIEKALTTKYHRSEIFK
jgi:hypothetical protein